MNNITNNNRSQQVNQKIFDSKIMLTINGNGNTLNNLIDTLHALSSGALALFEQMLEYGHMFQYIRFSQETMGHHQGYTREHTNVLLHELKDAGLIHFYGPHREVCNYFINQMFLLPQIRYLLQHWFPVLKTIVKIILTPLRTKDIYTKNVPPKPKKQSNVMTFFKDMRYPSCFWPVDKAPPPES